MARRKAWSRSVGKHGARVTIEERTYGAPVQLRWRDAGKAGGYARRSLGFKVRRDDGSLDPAAVDRALKALDQHTLGRTPGAIAAGPPTVGALLANYADAHGAKRDPTYARRWSAFLKPGTTIDRVLSGHLEDFARKRAAEGAARSTIETECRWLRSVAHWARKRNLATRDELAGIIECDMSADVLRSIDRTAPDKRRPRWTEEETALLLEHADEFHPYLATAIILAWETGRRFGAIRRLKWSDIDLAAGTVTWLAETDKVGVRWDDIPLSERALVALRDHRGRYPGVGGAYVFAGLSNGGSAISGSYWSEVFNKCARKAGVYEPRKGFHGFRRAWADRMRELPDVDVMRVGGWRDVTVYKGTYQRATREGMEVVVGRKKRA